MELDKEFLQDIRNIFQSARGKAYTLVNQAMISGYWEIGYRIAQEEQKGEDRAQYGAFLLRQLAVELSQELDKRLDERELRKMRQFYQLFQIRDALRPELGWAHYRLLLRVEDPKARTYYQDEAANQRWSTRLLERNIQTASYIRILNNRGPELSGAPDQQGGGLTAGDLVKDPYVFEFLGLTMPAALTENQLESAILSKLQQFLLEMGKGFAFVGRQYAVKTDTKIFYIDLVFYNYLLKCFVLIDLKISELTHQDIGQMDMYVRLWQHLKSVPTDNPAIGIILCSEKDATLVKYSVLDENKNLFASRYRLVLPSEEELQREIDLIKHSAK